jgi:hypothetical protein
MSTELAELEQTIAAQLECPCKLYFLRLGPQGNGDEYKRCIGITSEFAWASGQSIWRDNFQVQFFFKKCMNNRALNGLEFGDHFFKVNTHPIPNYTSSTNYKLFLLLFAVVARQPKVNSMQWVASTTWFMTTGAVYCACNWQWEAYVNMAQHVISLLLTGSMLSCGLWHCFNGKMCALQRRTPPYGLVKGLTFL